MIEHAPTGADIRVDVDRALPPVRGLPRVPSHGALPHEKVSPGRVRHAWAAGSRSPSMDSDAVPARRGRDDRYTERAKLPTVDEVPGSRRRQQRIKTLLSNGVAACVYFSCFCFP